MDFISHQLAQGGIHHAVALQRGLASERLANDTSFKMYTVVASDANLRTRQSFTDHLLYSGAIHRLCNLVIEIIGLTTPKAGHHNGNRTDNEKYLQSPVLSAG